MGIISWIIFGLLAGLVAKLLTPGRDPGGFFVTILIGIAGALIGGFIARALGMGDINGFNLGSFLIAVAGSVILLIGYRMVKNRT